MLHRQHVASDAGVLVAATLPATRLARPRQAAGAVQKQGWVTCYMDKLCVGAAGSGRLPEPGIG